MQIEELIWPADRIEHISRHGIQPEEVEEVCFGQSLVLRAASRGKSPVYYVLGQSSSGRHLFCVIIQFPGGRGLPVRARPMTRKEKERFRPWKKA